MSCLGFMSPAQRAALAASSREDAAGVPLSAFASPAPSEGKVRRIRVLAESPKAAMRESAALAYHAPRDVLERLAADPAASVRRCVARNERTSPPVLARLASDPDPFVRGWAAAHPGAPEELLALLSEDPDPVVRAVVTWAHGWT